MDLDVVGWLLGLVGQNLWQIGLTLKQALEGWWQDFSQLSGRCELEELCKTEFWVWLIVLFAFIIPFLWFVYDFVRDLFWRQPKRQRRKELFEKITNLETPESKENLSKSTLGDRKWIADNLVKYDADFELLISKGSDKQAKAVREVLNGWQKTLEGFLSAEQINDSDKWFYAKENQDSDKWFYANENQDRDLLLLLLKIETLQFGCNAKANKKDTIIYIATNKNKYICAHERPTHLSCLDAIKRWFDKHHQYLHEIFKKGTDRNRSLARDYIERRNTILNELDERKLDENNQKTLNKLRNDLEDLRDDIFLTKFERRKIYIWLYVWPIWFVVYLPMIILRWLIYTTRPSEPYFIDFPQDLREKEEKEQRYYLWANKSGYYTPRLVAPSELSEYPVSSWPRPSWREGGREYDSKSKKSNEVDGQSNRSGENNAKQQDEKDKAGEWEEVWDETTRQSFPTIRPSTFVEVKPFIPFGTSVGIILSIFIISFYYDNWFLANGEMVLWNKFSGNNPFEQFVRILVFSSIAFLHIMLAAMFVNFATYFYRKFFWRRCEILALNLLAWVTRGKRLHKIARNLDKSPLSRDGSRWVEWHEVRRFADEQEFDSLTKDFTKKNQNDYFDIKSFETPTQFVREANWTAKFLSRIDDAISTSGGSFDAKEAARHLDTENSRELNDEIRPIRRARYKIRLTAAAIHATNSLGELISSAAPYIFLLVLVFGAKINDSFDFSNYGLLPAVFEWQVDSYLVSAVFILGLIVCALPGAAAIQALFSFVFLRISSAPVSLRSANLIFQLMLGLIYVLAAAGFIALAVYTFQEETETEIFKTETKNFAEVLNSYGRSASNPAEFDDYHYHPGMTYLETVFQSISNFLCQTYAPGVENTKLTDGKAICGISIQKTKDDNNQQLESAGNQPYTLVIKRLFGTVVLWLFGYVLLRYYVNRYQIEHYDRNDKGFSLPPEAILLVGFTSLFLVSSFHLYYTILVFVGGIGSNVSESATPAGSAGTIVPFGFFVALVGGLMAIATRDLLENYFAGLARRVDPPFEVGDRITVDGGEMSRVEKIGPRSVSLFELTSNSVIHIPHQELKTRTVRNHTAPTLDYRRQLCFHILGNPTSHDIRNIEGAFLAIASLHSGIKHARVLRQWDELMNINELKEFFDDAGIPCETNEDLKDKLITSYPEDQIWDAIGRYWRECSNGTKKVSESGIWKAYKHLSLQQSTSKPSAQEDEEKALYIDGINEFLNDKLGGLKSEIQEDDTPAQLELEAFLQMLRCIIELVITTAAFKEIQRNPENWSPSSEPETATSASDTSARADISDSPLRPVLFPEKEFERHKKYKRLIYKKKELNKPNNSWGLLCEHAIRQSKLYEQIAQLLWDFKYTKNQLRAQDRQLDQLSERLLDPPRVFSEQCISQEGQIYWSIRLKLTVEISEQSEEIFHHLNVSILEYLEWVDESLDVTHRPAEIDEAFWKIGRPASNSEASSSPIGETTPGTRHT